MQQSDVLIQASSTEPTSDGWHVVHRAAGPISAQAWIQALSVARRIAREHKVDIYRADADAAPELCESYRL